MPKKLLTFLILVLMGVMIVPLPSNTLAQAEDEIDRTALLHNSFSDLYRTPGGAVTAGTPVTLRLRAAAGDLDSASVRVFRARTGAEALLPMKVVATTPEGYDFWEATVELEALSVYWYRFIVTKGDQTLYYEDDIIPNDDTFTLLNEGGSGAAYDRSPDLSFQITVYDEGFYTPAWVREGVIYQIFPDRFRNGDIANDPTDGADVFYGNLELSFHETWNEPPVDGRQPGNVFNSDFFGGDIAGIIEKLDYLQELGVTGIYLNPIFAARSNHRYDTADYFMIDPLLGTMEEFQTLVSEANARGIQIILDGVFNHLSSDSFYFDRYDRFEGEEGACESVDSPYRDWFYFTSPTGAEPAACVDAGDGATFYESFFNFDSIPKVNIELRAPRRYFLNSQNSVTNFWGNQGIGGWRLDAADLVDDGGTENRFWEIFRQTVRAGNGEGFIVGEFWKDSSPWLLGDQWDAAMNYRMRALILGMVRGSNYDDADPFIPGLTPSQFESQMRAIEEDYPPMALYAMMNLLGSHDTSRALFVLDNDVEALKIAAMLQFTVPGAPTIYYGDEIALDAPSVSDGNQFQDDPYNRAPYPWADTEGDHYGPPDDSVLGFYQVLSQTRANNPALRQGELITLLTDDEKGILAFLRRDVAAGNAAIVVFNTGEESQEVALDFNGLLPAGLTMLPFLETDAIETAGGSATVTVQPRSGNIWTDTLDGGFIQPAAPQNLEGQGAPTQVDLRWDAVEGATGYRVYRSPVAVGGFEPISAEITETQFSDTAVTTGFQYYYAVVAIRDGLAGAMSVPVTVVPSATIESVFYVGDDAGDETPDYARVALELRSGLTVEIEAGIRIPGFTEAEGAARGVRAEAALVPADQEVESANWQPMTYSSDANGADLFTAAVAVEGVGDYVAIARFSSDAGLNWIVVEFRNGTLPQVAVAPSSDLEAPAEPENVEVARISLSGVTLRWQGVSAADLFGYRIYRLDENLETVLIAEVGSDVTTYTDVNVSRGNQYSYAVSALDNALNESAARATDLIVVEQLNVPVVFIANVPTNTPNDPAVFIAGDFGEGFPVWDPSGLQMTQISDTQWSVTLELPEGASIQYKFVREDWIAVEKSDACEEIENRRFVVDTTQISGDGTITVEHDVAKWRDLDQCP